MKLFQAVKLYFFKRGWFGEPLALHSKQLKHVVAYGDEAPAMKYALADHKRIYLLPAVADWLENVEHRMSLFDRRTGTNLTIWFMVPEDALQFRLTFL
jgi:hypothetical protein